MTKREMRVLTAEDLRERLRRIDGRGYKAYRDLEGVYRFADFDLFIDHVQGDPFAPPSRIRVRLRLEDAGFPSWSWASRVAQVALCDFLVRKLFRAVRRFAKRTGTGNGGSSLPPLRARRSSNAPPSSSTESSGVLPGGALRSRSSRPRADDRRRCGAGTLFRPDPAGRRPRPKISCGGPRGARATRCRRGGPSRVARASRGTGLGCFCSRREHLAAAFGASDAPMPSERAVAFTSPPERRVAVRLPHAGEITGMAIPRGVTLIVGGGYHGKSTLLRALELGVYDHIPGDGREYVVTLRDAVKVRAEDRRSVVGVDIHAFIGELPGARIRAAFRALRQAEVRPKRQIWWKLGRRERALSSWTKIRVRRTFSSATHACRRSCPSLPNRSLPGRSHPRSSPGFRDVDDSGRGRRG